LDFYTDLWRQHGDVFHHRIGRVAVYGFIHPDDVDYVLTTNKDNFDKGTLIELRGRRVMGQSLLMSEGDVWSQLRRLMDPPFSKEGVPEFFGTMSGASEMLLERWQEVAESGETVDVLDEMMLVSFSMISRLVFNQDLSRGASEIRHAITYLLGYIQEIILAVIDIPPSIPTPRNRRFRAAKRIVDDFVSAHIEARRQNPDAAPDLIAHLLQARDEKGQGMTETQIRDQVMTTFVAGQENAALVLAWFWYLLSQHPEVEERVHAELSSVLGGRMPTLEDVPALDYTRRTLEETMRLYPPLWIQGRVNLQQDEIGGYRIPPRSTVILIEYLTQRHPQFFKDPDRFDPDRMLPERVEGLPHYAFFPFGGGKRKCIGNKYSILSFLIVVGTLAQHFRVRLKPGHPVVPVAVSALRPRDGLPVTLERR
jgi:cytochrome P450